MTHAFSFVSSRLQDIFSGSAGAEYDDMDDFM